MPAEERVKRPTSLTPFFLPTGQTVELDGRKLLSRVLGAEECMSAQWIVSTCNTTADSSAAVGHPEKPQHGVPENMPEKDRGWPEGEPVTSYAQRQSGGIWSSLRAWGREPMPLDPGSETLLALGAEGSG